MPAPHRKSEVVPEQSNPAKRLMYAVAVRAALDLMKASTPELHRYTARKFIAENKELLMQAGIPARKVNMLLQQSGVDVATSTPAGASR